MVERGPLREFLDLSFERAHLYFVLSHQRLEPPDMLFFRLVDVASALRGLLTRVARLSESQRQSPRAARTHIECS